LIFLRIYIDFTTSLEKLENINTDLQRSPWNFHKPPRNLKLIAQGSLAGGRRQRRRRRPVSRRGSSSEVGEMRGKGRERERGEREREWRERKEKSTV